MNNCMLKRTPASCRTLGYNDNCDTCGWCYAEAKRRTEYIREYGLTKCEDGLYRLVMEEKKDDNV